MSVESIKAKQAVVDEIKGKLDKAQSAVVIDYMGVTVEQADAIRKQFREAGLDYKVYKNTIFKRAIEGTAYEGLGQVLEGPSAFLFGYDDAVAPAREANKAMKSTGKMAFKAGVVEGDFYDAEGITAIAMLPSREELIAKFMGSISSPIQKFAYLMSAIAEAKEGGADFSAAAPAEEAPAEEAPAEAAEAAPAEETPAE